MSTIDNLNITAYNNKRAIFLNEVLTAVHGDVETGEHLVRTYVKNLGLEDRLYASLLDWNIYFKKFFLGFLPIWIKIKYPALFNVNNGDEYLILHRRAPKPPKFARRK